jgi:hypothetical protein
MTVPMAEPHHKADTQLGCDVQGCKEVAERSINAKKAEGAGLKLSSSEGGNAHLCKKHYREYKKSIKKDRDLERAGW